MGRPPGQSVRHRFGEDEHRPSGSRLRRRQPDQGRPVATASSIACLACTATLRTRTFPSSNCPCGCSSNWNPGRSPRNRDWRASALLVLAAAIRMWSWRKPRFLLQRQRPTRANRVPTCCLCRRAPSGLWATSCAGMRNASAANHHVGVMYVTRLPQRRDHHDCRLAVLADSSMLAAELLEQWRSGGRQPTDSAARDDARRHQGADGSRALLPTRLFTGRKPFGPKPEGGVRLWRPSRRLDFPCEPHGPHRPRSGGGLGGSRWRSESRGRRVVPGGRGARRLQVGRGRLLAARSPDAATGPDRLVAPRGRDAGRGPGARRRRTGSGLRRGDCHRRGSVTRRCGSASRCRRTTVPWAVAPASSAPVPVRDGRTRALRPRSRRGSLAVVPRKRHRCDGGSPHAVSATRGTCAWKFGPAALTESITGLLMQRAAAWRRRVFTAGDGRKRWGGVNGLRQAVRPPVPTCPGQRCPPAQGRCVRLPTYPWQRQRLWALAQGWADVFLGASDAGV